MITETIAEHDEDLIAFDGALQVLGTSRATLYRLLGQGDVKGLKVGKQWRFRRADLLAYVQRSPVAIAAAPDSDLDGELDFLERELRAVGYVIGERPETPEQKVAALLTNLFQLATEWKASDIHLDPVMLDGALCLWVRLRIDGVLQELRRVPMTLHEAIMAQLKTGANMDPLEKRCPQHGRISFEEFDLRAAIVPGFRGEMATLRILRANGILMPLDAPQLGLSADDLARLRGLLKQPSGILLFTGQAGSGKRVTLYSSLRELAGPTIKTISIEDPVEFELPYVNQTQVNERTGQTAASALRACMRLDPDVVYVAESGMLSIETARAMTEAALSGHLLLTNLACNDALAAITRLTDIGLEPYLIASTVACIVSQCLCRRLCVHCREAHVIPSGDLAAFGFPISAQSETITVYRAAGCDQCRGRGYLGRTGLYEILVMTEEIAGLVTSGAALPEIRTAAQHNGMTSLWDDAFAKVRSGITSPEEVARVLYSVKS